MLKRYMKFLHDRAERDYRRRLLSLLHRDQASRLLDLGCDDGSWTARLAERVGVPPASVVGVDRVRERMREASVRGIQAAEAELDRPLPFADDSFDVVHANQVIEHVHDLDGFVSEIYRVLRPQGYAVVCTENLASWHNVAALLLGFQPFSLTNISATGVIGNPLALHGHEPPGTGMHGYNTWFHTRVLAYTAFRKIFEAHGFVVEKMGGTGYYPLPPPLDRLASRLDRRHTHYIYLRARKPGKNARRGSGGR